MEGGDLLDQLSIIDKKSARAYAILALADLIEDGQLSIKSRKHELKKVAESFANCMDFFMEDLSEEEAARLAEQISEKK